MGIRGFASFLVIFSLCLLWGGDISAGQYTDEYSEGEVLVKFGPRALDGDMKAALKQVNGDIKKKFRVVNNLVRIKLRPGMSVPDAINLLAKNPLVVYAEPNYLRYASGVPNDPDFGNLWGLDNTGQTGGTPDADVDAPEAWNITTGSSQNVVAVIDTGIDLDHVDLAANIWTNPGEIAGNGIDDDANGYVDDVYGWDFYANDADPNDTTACSHGTHVAGTIGAVGNNDAGVAGVNWQVKLMALRFLGGPFCSGTDADSIEAIQYASEKGARIANASWGGSAYSKSVEDAIRNSGLLFIAAAGNGGLDGVGDNNDAKPQYPSNYALENIVAVAATDHNDLRASFSNYGTATVDLAAPGVDILSTVPGSLYDTFSGTSMATPHVSGAAALVLAQDPSLENWQVIWKLLQGTDDLGLQVLSGGRLNAYDSLLLASPLKTRNEETLLSYSGSWSSYSNPSFSGGRGRVSRQAQAAALFTFTGSGVKWVSARARNLGKADVYLDDVFMQTVDLYYPGTLYQQAVYSNLALDPGTHTIKIVVKGQKNPKSRGYYVPIDAIDVVQ